jgi:membrane associated rhomboid family serine protease
VLPLHDENPTRTKPIVTLLLIAACVVVYFGFQPKGSGDTAFTYRQAAIPCEVTTGHPLTINEIEQATCNRHDEESPAFPQKHVWVSILVSMFLHGGLLHLGGNMLFLWIFGNNIEDTKGRVTYLAFYLVSGVVATLTFIALAPTSTVPLIGASGAIAGVMGAYLVLFPRVRIKTLFFFFIILFRSVEARWLLAFWFVSQFFVNPSEGVAWTAHVGGFVFGVLVGLVWRARRKPEAARAAYLPYA